MTQPKGRSKKRGFFLLTFDFIAKLKSRMYRAVLECYEQSPIALSSLSKRSFLRDERCHSLLRLHSDEFKSCLLATTHFVEKFNGMTPDLVRGLTRNRLFNPMSMEIGAR